MLASVAIVGTASAQHSARYLYVENCSDYDLSHIRVETKTTEPEAEWKASGRQWVHLPLKPNEAACFDTADMYGDVPEGDFARLVLRQAPELVVPGETSESEASDDVYYDDDDYDDDDYEDYEDEDEDEDGEISCPSVRVDKSNQGDFLVHRVLSYPVINDKVYFDEGCHGLTALDWQPRNRCSGPGERSVGIQC